MHRWFSTGRPFRVLGIQQVSVAGKDVKELLNFWSDVMELGDPTGTTRSKRDNVHAKMIPIGGGAAVAKHGCMTLLSCIEPLDLEAKPKVHTKPLHHIGLWVDDLESCVSFLKSQNVRFVGQGIYRGAMGYDVAFIHPKPILSAPVSGCGVLIQLVQASEEMIQLNKPH